MRNVAEEEGKKKKIWRQTERGQKRINNCYDEVEVFFILIR